MRNPASTCKEAIMVTSIRRRIPRLIGASGLAATLALGAGAATARAAHQEAPRAKAAPTAPCSKQNPCTGSNQNNQSSGNAVGNQNNQSSGNTRGKLPPGTSYDIDPGYNDTRGKLPPGTSYDIDPGYNDTRGKLPPGYELPDCGHSYCPDGMTHDNRNFPPGTPI
jgi:hypothetical protein